MYWKGNYIMEKNNKRIVSIKNENKDFLIYFNGTNCYDENFYGMKSEREVIAYLDENLNTFVLNVDKRDAKEKLYSFLEKGYPVFIGPHSPEVEDIKEVKLPNGKKIMQEVMVPNTNPNTVGIWRVSTREEKSNYIRILQKQSEERMYLKLYNNK